MLITRIDGRLVLFWWFHNQCEYYFPEGGPSGSARNLFCAMNEAWRWTQRRDARFPESNGRKNR